MIGDSSMVNFRRQGDRTVKLDFTERTGGKGIIHLYYAGKFVKTIKIDLTSGMEVKGMEMKHHG